MLRKTSFTIFAALFSFALTVQGQSRELPDFTELVKNSSAAVVNISTTQKRSGQSRPQLPKGLKIPDLPEDSPFNEFFKRFFGEGGRQDFSTQSLGSGFIISPDGYMITNNHLIKDADEVIVRLTDRREFKARIVGADERSDIALLKIDATDLPSVRLGTDYKLKVGEWVLAIGSPFGFDHSVTQGIVSAIGRNLPRENYVPFIQTDVAINPGNSGGPLFNLDGQVVGVNSQIFSRTGGFMGLSFAIPIKMVMDVADQIRRNGKVSRAWLGVLIQDVTRELAESFDMDKPQGALVAKVLDDSPASTAGLQVGDIVLAFDDQEVNRSSDLPPIVGSTRVGIDVSVKILRNSKTMILQVKTAELPDDDQIRLGSRSAPGTAADSKLGISVANLSEEQRKEMDVQEHGVLVTEVRPGPAKNAGVRKGDLLLMLDNNKIKDSKEYKELSRKIPAGKTVSILVQRKGNPIFLALKTGE